MEDKFSYRIVKSPVVPVSLVKTPLDRPTPESFDGLGMVYSVQLADGRWVTRPSDY
jgi:hypothetical protein